MFEKSFAEARKKYFYSHACALIRSLLILSPAGSRLRPKSISTHPAPVERFGR